MTIDHLDNDGSNNDIDNLVAACHRCNCTRQRIDLFTEDDIIHEYRTKTGIKRTRGVYKTCMTCGVTFTIKAADKRPRAGRYCSRNCFHNRPR